jgi:hypothetical protein
MLAHFAHRENDGLTVDLYWEHGPHHDAFRVEVVDSREQQRLTLHPATGKAALDAFYHPFSNDELTGRSGGFAGANHLASP